MSVKKIAAYQTSDGIVHLDEMTAEKHELALQAGTTADRVGLFATLLADAKAGDIEGAFEAVIKDGPLHPVEEAVRWLAGVFQFGRAQHKIRAATDAVASDPTGDDKDEEDEEAQQAPAPTPAPAPATVAIPEDPRPNIFGR